MFKSTDLSIISITVYFPFWFLILSYGQEMNTSTDYAALTAFKSHLVIETNNIVSTNWTSTTHFCDWFGVSCSNQRRVTSLQLSGLDLGGEISSDVAYMTHLVELDLSGNKLVGILPSEFGSLQKLEILNVTGNSLQGSIPANLSRCQTLRLLDLSFNFIAGSIPAELGLLSDLRILALDHNNFTGKIPTSFGNFSKLEYFYLHENDLVDEIPAEIGKLTSLLGLALRGNRHTGSIPPSIFNISTLGIVDLSINRLSGQLPEDVGDHLPNLEQLFLDGNRITGNIPASMCNASKLTRLFLTENDLQGNIPSELGRLLNLQWFDFEYNQISGGIPFGIFNITSLRVLRTRRNYLSGVLPHDLGNWIPNLEEISLSHNQFTGEIPSSICNATKLIMIEAANNSFCGPVPVMLGNLLQLEDLNLQYNSLANSPYSTNIDFLNSLVNCRNLQYLILSSNPFNCILPESVGNLSSNLRVFAAISCEFKGGIPHGLGNLTSLNYLGLSDNNLQGAVPSSFSSLPNLERVYLTRNKLKGSIPAEICSINILGILHLGENSFSGSIPSCIQNLTELRDFSVAANNLNSTIPPGLWNMGNVRGLNLSRNLLHGSIPTEVGNLKALDIMDLSSNDFSGELPSSIGSLQNLLALHLSQNKLQGPIPGTLSNLIVIDFLDLSSNRLSGNIPAFLGSLRDLKYLNLSFNMLEGEIPHTGVFTNISYEHLMGNPNLCGAPNLNFSLCPPQSFRQRKQTTSLILKITIPISAVFLLLVLLLLSWIFLSRKKQKKNATEAGTPWMGHRAVTYYEILRATESFSTSNLVGEGSSCMVYKGNLSDGTLAAFKVFNMQYTRTLTNFDAECEVLRNVRHRNLVRIISTCSNLDFKAMVLEYMHNGSLHTWLHSKSDSLSLVQRLDIVTDVALAMEYLHHEYTVPIVHCDLKPANVLLDNDMTAHVADFGISKILGQDQEFVRTKTLGTIGYMPPENGFDGKISTKGDVYSFGILLLETLTGKCPTDDMFKEDLRLHQWVQSVFPDALIEVLDSNLFPKEDNRQVNKNQNRVKQALISIIGVALLCLNESPGQRIDMRSAVVQLKKIRAELEKKQ